MSGAPATPYLTNTGVPSPAPTPYVAIPTTLGKPIPSNTYGYQSNVGRGLEDLSPYTLSRSNTYLQGQDATKDLLCGMYSLNHILQGEYFVYRPEEALRIQDGPISKINLWFICNTNHGLCIPANTGRGPELVGQFELGLFSRIAEELSLRVETVDYQSTLTLDADFESLQSEQAEILTVGSNNYPPRPPARAEAGEETPVEKLYRIWGLMMQAAQTKFELVSADRATLNAYLDPTAVPKYMYEANSYAIMAKLNVELDKSDLLGVVFGSSNHWIALVKYSNLCLAEAEPRYTIIDSLGVKLGEGIPRCLTKNELLLTVANYADEATWGMGTSNMNASGRRIQIRVPVGKAAFIYSTAATPPTIEAVRRMHLAPKIQQQRRRLLNSGYHNSGLVEILAHNVRAAENTNANINARTAGRVVAIPAAPATAATRAKYIAGLKPKDFATMLSDEIERISIKELDSLGDDAFDAYDKRITSLRAVKNEISLANLTSAAKAEVNAKAVVAKPVPGSKILESFGSSTWKCPTCTFDNPNSNKVCEVCGTPRPASGGRKTRRARKQKRRSTLRR